MTGSRNRPPELQAMASSHAHPPSTPLERVLRDFDAVVAELPEAALPRLARTRAREELSRLGWPSARDEQWRYANLRAFERVQFRPAPTIDTPHPELPAPLPGFERMVFIDGVRTGARHDGVTSNGISWPAEQRLGFLCDMFARDVAALRINGSTAIELLFVTTGTAAGAVYPRLQVELQAGSQLQLVERHLGAPSQATLVAANVAINLGRGASLSHYRLQQCGPQTLFSDTVSAEIGEDASYSVRQIAIGAATARTSARIRLNGRAAAFNWQGIAVGRAKQVHDIALRVEHRAPATRTEEVFRGIADEKARIAFSGHIHIAAEAPGSDARQSLRGLIEGTGAEMDLRPRLEINTDDVRAQHGATTGQMDENLLFYLLSRGLEPSIARALLKWAFLGDVLRAIDLPALRSVAEHGAAGQLPDLIAIGALT
jgi:Fe-S cluster assembly protein SufD